MGVMHLQDIYFGEEFQRCDMKDTFRWPLSDCLRAGDSLRLLASFIPIKKITVSHSSACTWS
jgi:hypothetical protein